MKLLSVNVAQPRELVYRRKCVQTAIFKTPVEGRVLLGRENLDGDRQADLRVHGGEDKAVYVYPHEHYRYWAEQLRRDGFDYGHFGENFTTEGLSEEGVFIGDVFRVGSALVQVSQPRTPCYKLDLKMDISNFRFRFSASGKIGFYLRVLEEGEVSSGQKISLERRDEVGVSVREAFALRHDAKPGRDRLECAIGSPALAENWRAGLRLRLQEIQK